MLFLRAFEANLIRDKNNRQASVTLIPNFPRFFTEHLRPNYLGDVATYVSRFHFKSNFGKVSLNDDDDDDRALVFDPVEVPMMPQNQRSIDLLVYTYTVSNNN